MKHVLFALAATGPLALGACGGDDGGHNRPPPPSWATTHPAGAPGAATPAAAPAAAKPDDARARFLAELRDRKWKPEDFLESDANRDPFHSFIVDFSGGPTLDTRQYEVYLSKFSLDELKLVMITSPRGGGGRTGHFKRTKNDPACDIRPCAMFLDGTGAGVAVARDFHISKSDARVVRIDPEKGQVFVELTEDLGNGKSRVVERVLDMHPTVEGQNQ
jgi:hypothetical protein